MALTVDEEKDLMNRVDILFKMFFAQKAATNLNKEHFEEAFPFAMPVFPSQVIQDESLIPAIAAATPGVVELITDKVMIPVDGSPDSFYHPDLVDGIPFYFGDGSSYIQSIKKDDNSEIPFGQNSWIFHAQAGVLWFMDGLPSGVTALLPPKITIYKYIGAKGVGGSGSTAISTNVIPQGTGTGIQDSTGGIDDLTGGMYFANIDDLTVSRYALWQASGGNGETWLNAGAGAIVNITINNAKKISIKDSGGSGVSIAHGVVDDIVSIGESTTGTGVGARVHTKGLSDDNSKNTATWSSLTGGATYDMIVRGDGRVAIGTLTLTALLNLGASTTSQASLNIADGAAVSVPINGDFFMVSGVVKVRTGGVTKDLGAGSGDMLSTNNLLDVVNVVTAWGNIFQAHTHAASEVTDFDTEVSNNTDVAANTAKVTNVTTNLSTTQTATTVDVVSSDGTDATLPQAIAGGNAGVLSGADKTTLDATSGTNSGDQTDSEIETAYQNQVPFVSQAEAEAGTETAERRYSPERIKQAIEALSDTKQSEVEQTVVLITIATHTLSNSDHGKKLEFSFNGPIALTLNTGLSGPNSSKFACVYEVTNTLSQVTISGTATLVNIDGAFKTEAQHAVVAIIPKNATDEYNIQGRLVS